MRVRKVSMKRQIGLPVALIFFALAQMAFDFSRHNIPLNEIYDGGPPKDGIPALYDPRFVKADEARFLSPGDRVLGLSMKGEAKAYPIKILNWHELVNDRIGEEWVLISFCPLCGTGMAFDAELNGQRFLFGVSGKLYNSDVLFYDKKTESLWSQIKMQAVTGSMIGTRLTLLPIEHTTWDDWQSRHPETQVLSDQTGTPRNYAVNPYEGYENHEKTFFQVSHEDTRLPRKAWVLGVTVGGKAKAYAFERLAKEPGFLCDQVGGQTIIVRYDPKNRSAIVTDAQGVAVPSVQAYWFAWAAFYPETELFL